MNTLTTEDGYSLLATTTDMPSAAPEWIKLSNEIIYYAFPVIIGLGLVLGVLNIIVLSNQVNVSVDSYLIGLSVAGTLLVVCAGIIKVPLYIGHNEILVQMYPCLVGLYDWFKYCVVWVIIVMSLERCMSVTQHRIKSTCSRMQAFLTIGMVYLVSLVSALPEFWATEVHETKNFLTNETMTVAVRSPSASSAEYEIYYWYTRVFYIFLAYPMLFILFFILLWNSRRATSRKYSLKHGTGVVLTRKVSQEMSLTRLHVMMILMYLLLTGPQTIYTLLHNLPWDLALPGNTLKQGLLQIFECWFFLFFIIEFFLFLIFNGKFRFTFASLCCCCCQKE